VYLVRLFVVLGLFSLPLQLNTSLSLQRGERGTQPLFPSQHHELAAVLPPNRIEPLRSEPSSGFGSTGIKSVRFDDNPNHEIQDRFDSAVRDLRFDSIRFEYSRLELNQLSNLFDSVDSVYYSMSLYSPMAMSYPTICNGFSCF
jgi:hypothetical protein